MDLRDGVSARQNQQRGEGKGDERKAPGWATENRHEPRKESPLRSDGSAPSAMSRESQQRGDEENAASNLIEIEKGLAEKE